MISERTIAFGPEDALIGTLCLPEPGVAAGAGADLGQILFNAGIVHRVGPHRLNVKLARRLARRGIPSLRFDLSGLGDSARPAADNSFEQQAVIDLQHAMDALAQQAGVSRFALLGFCSGGRHSYEAAPQDARIAGIVLYDTYAFHTARSRLIRVRLRLREYGLIKVAGSLVRGVAATCLRRLRQWLGATQPGPAGATAAVVPGPARAAFAARLRELHARGVTVGVLYSGEGENYNYRGQFADSLRGCGGTDHVDFEYLPAMDHAVMTLAMQDRFLDWLEAWTVKVARRWSKHG